MDLALAMSLLKQADRCGAEDACLIFTKRTIRSETLDSKKIAHELRHESSCRLAVRVGCGTATVELFQGKAGMPGDSALLERVKNLCQGARLCAAWGATDDQLEAMLRKFDRQAAVAFKLSETCLSAGSTCEVDCFGEKCLEIEDPSYASLLHSIALKMQPLARQISWRGQLDLVWCEETLYRGSDARTVSRFEAYLDQWLSAKGMHDIRLPRYSFAEPVFEMAAHPMLFDASDVARGIVESASSGASYGFDGRGLVLSGWAMAVLGHEAHHLNVDITRSGRLAYDVSRCMTVPDVGGRCRNLAMKITLESNLTRDVLFTRVPDHTLYVDAPDFWIRRNEKILDVQFLTAAEVMGGKIAGYLAPVVLRFDLTKLWYYCPLASKPYVRISLKCGEDDTVSQAPCGYFDVEPAQGML